MFAANAEYFIWQYKLLKLNSQNKDIFKEQTI